VAAVRPRGRIQLALPTILAAVLLPVSGCDGDESAPVVRIEDSGAILILSDNVYDGFSLRYRRVEE
jgi:hypothetical protein